MSLTDGAGDEPDGGHLEHPELGRGLIARLRGVKRLAYFSYRFVQMNYRKQKLYRRCRHILRSGETLPQSLISPYLWQAHNDLLNNYELRPFPGQITLFRSSETQVHNPTRADIGWTPLAQGGLEVHVVHGTHNLVKEPYVAELAHLLKLSIDKATQKSR